MTGPRYQFRMSEDERQALRRLAEAECRTMSQQLSYMIRAEAAKRGFWSPSRPSIVPHHSTKADRG